MHGLAQLAPGTVFADDFRIIRPLAAGGMGAVYVAEQISTAKARALKLMHPNLVANSRSRERFTLEAQISSQIENDHIVSTIAAGVEKGTGTPWIAMELLTGRTLDTVLYEQGAQSYADSREIVKQLGHGLGEAHDMGLVHRDLKPENLFIATPRRSDVLFTLKILDFGIAKWMTEAQELAKNSQVIGSPSWMAPEQLEHNSIILPSTDVWALGLIAFNLLTGTMNWRTCNQENASINGILFELAVAPLDPASSRAAQLGVGQLIPKGFDAWMANCLDRDPISRYPTASDAVSELLPLLEQSEDTPKTKGENGGQLLGNRTLAFYDNALFKLADVEPLALAGNASPDNLENQLATAVSPTEKADMAVRVAEAENDDEAGRERARNAYQRALQLVPEHRQARAGLSQLYLKMQRWHDALESMCTELDQHQSAMSSEQVRALRYNIVDAIRRNAGPILAPERVFHALKEDPPIHAVIATARVDLAFQMGQPDNAIAILEALVEQPNVQPASLVASLRERLVGLRELRGRVAARVEEVRCDPPQSNSAQGWLQFAREHEAQNRIQLAELAYEQVLLRDLMNMDAHERLIDLAEQDDDLERAINIARASMVLFPKSAPANARKLAARHPASVQPPQNRLTQDCFNSDVMHPFQDRGLSVLFSGVPSSLLPEPKGDNNLLDKFLFDPFRGSPAILRQGKRVYLALLNAAALLDVPALPSIYVQPSDKYHLRARGDSRRASVGGGVGSEATIIGSDLLAMHDATGTSFVTATHLTMYRSECHLYAHFSDGGALAKWIGLLRQAVTGVGSADPDEAQTLAQKLAKLPANLTRMLTSTFAYMPNVDDGMTEEWLAAVELTCIRAGLLLSGDLAKARALCSAEWTTAHGSHTTPAQREATLFEFARSKAYVTARKKLGMPQVQAS